MHKEEGMLLGILKEGTPSSDARRGWAGEGVK